jgi:hypothetical protein
VYLFGTDGRQGTGDDAMEPGSRIHPYFPFQISKYVGLLACVLIVAEYHGDTFKSCSILCLLFSSFVLSFFQFICIRQEVSISQSENWASPPAYQRQQKATWGSSYISIFILLC